MSVIAKSGNPSLSSLLPPPCNKMTRKCGEDIAAGDQVYLKSDGLFWRANGTAANAAARVRGIVFIPGKVAQGQPVTAWFGVTCNYGAGLTPGADVYLAATAGAIDSAATTGGTAPIGYCVDATRIFFFAPN